MHSAVVALYCKAGTYPFQLSLPLFFLFMLSVWDHQILNTMQRTVPDCNLKSEKVCKAQQVSLRKKLFFFLDNIGQTRKLGLGEEIGTSWYVVQPGGNPTWCSVCFLFTAACSSSGGPTCSLRLHEHYYPVMK